MRYAPYLADVSMSFSKLPDNYLEIAVGWSEAALETVVGSYLEYESLPYLMDPTKPFFRFVQIPDNQASKGSFTASFTNGTPLVNAFMDVVFAPFLSCFEIRYKPYVDSESGQTVLAALLSWEIDPLLINQIGEYQLQIDGVSVNLDSRKTGWGINGINSGESFPFTLTAMDYKGMTLGTLKISLYAPSLTLIPARSNVSGLGYGKQVDASGVQEIYQSNHNKTLGQLTTPVQVHATESRSLSTNLPSMNPATVVSSSANDYVQSFDPNNYNNSFDYDSALEGASSIAPTTTATLIQNHTGNRSINHGGTVNQTTTVGAFGGLANVPQINNTIQNHTRSSRGNQFSQTAQNYYEQNQDETFICNEQSLQAPSYDESINVLDQQIGTSTINASVINFNGNVLTINGDVFINGKCDLAYCAPPSVKPFQQQVRVPLVTQNPELNELVAIVWAEAHLSNYICVNGQNYYAEDFINGAVPQSVIDDAVANQQRVTHWAVTSDAAIQAITSVILNRVAQKWEGYGTIHTVIADTGFDAYGKSDYTKALTAIQSSQLSSLSQLQHVYNLVKPMYDSKQATITANHYYSPVTQIFNKPPYNHPPAFSITDTYLVISGMIQTDNFAFYVGS